MVNLGTGPEFDRSQFESLGLFVAFQNLKKKNVLSSCYNLYTYRVFLVYIDLFILGYI